ncbi:GGDEF domain-containing response regulator [Paenibacillus sp. SYP-B4298]|uniref:GGDEF domain-containing response regulator n=1 Tax=Paenibacillus sp. SYP-B4298 TaxID=2996034 RepID=UPI0022DD4564|nr:diguanylate cyclase [Paenibacillus sp. SYP-B4298]
MERPAVATSRIGAARRSEQLLKEGRKRLVEELKNYIRELEVLLVRCEAGERGSAAALCRIAHTLKGSAPVFGLSRIGEIAEILWKQWEPVSAQQDQDKVRPLLYSGRQLVSQLWMEYEICVKEQQLETKGVRGSGGPAAAPSRLLIIDDDDVLRSYLARSLHYDGYEVMEAADVDSGKQMLRNHHFDLVILDLMMYPKSGYELFDFLKEDPTFKWLPLIVLSGRLDVQDKVQCFFLGADDYVTKPFEYEELSARIYSLLERNKGFEQMAFRDPLTGVFNRRYMDQQLQTELKRMEQYPAPMTLAFLDIDKFKLINDNYGHAAGDVVLQGLANVLQSQLRVTDFIARYGGEEFVIIMPGTTLAEGEKVLLGVLEVIRGAAVARDEVREYYITFSAGLAQWREGMSAEEWIKQADASMYASKAEGRNRITTRGEDGLLAAPDKPEELQKLLIVDDDEIIRSFIVKSLEALPLTVLQAASGKEALEVLSTEAVELCILDGMMPGMDGWEVLAQVRNNDRHADNPTKVIMLSSKKQEETAHPGSPISADEYMSKPFSIVELELKVKRLLNIEEHGLG